MLKFDRIEIDNDKNKLKDLKLKDKAKPKIKKHELILIIINTLVYVVWLFFNSKCIQLYTWMTLHLVISFKKNKNHIF